jgi:pathogenesis-related protein 1
MRNGTPEFIQVSVILLKREVMTKTSLLWKHLFGLALAGLLLCSFSCGKKATGLEVPLLSQSQKVTAERGRTPQIESIGLSIDEVQILLEEHNRVRSTVGVAPMVWSHNLAVYAQQWADHLADSDCRIEHRPVEGEWQGLYGENLFTGTADYYRVSDAVQAWESEKQFFKGEAVTLSNVQQVGHYTQLVWKATSQIGCGKAECQGRMILVCNYSPPGNVLGETPY